MPQVYNRLVGGYPKDAVYVGRPTRWGNPFTVKIHGRAECLALYGKWIFEPQQDYLRAAMKRELRGKNLLCWCEPLPCHAHLILKIANSEEADL